MKKLLAVIVLVALAASVTLSTVSVEEIMLHPVTRYVLAGYLLLNAYVLTTAKPLYLDITMKHFWGLSLGPLILLSSSTIPSTNFWQDAYSHETIHSMQTAAITAFCWSISYGGTNLEATMVESILRSSLKNPVFYGSAMLLGLSEGSLADAWKVNPWEQMACRYETKLSLQLFGVDQQ
jgi:hypothetical protein